MSENTTETIIGALVIALAAGFLFFATEATGIAPKKDSYELTASFRSADGISVGTEVRLAGVKIGTVTRLELNPRTFRAEAAVSIPNAVEIPEDSAILVSQDGLLGGNYIEILPGGAPFNLEPGTEIEDTQGSVSLISLMMKLVSGDQEQ
ncbi:outer membrane lipid asymmetry maintenance protein MlaD [Rhodovulum sp. YNF3179]|uniref:outer membrane lipid asymmetry maintenance protein MlaD n=1 Tax=Rhodovulum sp. YNF3179 TaxID=3425127 RepID=UPI003D3446B1